MIPSKTDLSWAAGLFEGEGSCCVCTDHNKGTKQARVKISMTDKDVIEHFHSVVGFGTVVPNGPSSKVLASRPDFKPQWCWSTGNFERVQYFICMFYSLMGTRRKQQMLNTLRIMRTYYGR